MCRLLKVTALVCSMATSLAFVAGCGGNGGGSNSTNPTSPTSVAGINVTAPLSASLSEASAANVAPQSSASLWSDKATWGGVKPVAGAAVLIPAGKQIILDESTPALGALTIEGELFFKQGATVELIADVIYVQRNGALRAGNAVEPYTGQATITLRSTDTAGSVAGMGTRGILVSSGGKLELFGKSTTVPWTKLNAHANLGST
jgi:hypothetical protein